MFSVYALGRADKDMNKQENVNKELKECFQILVERD